MIPRRKKPNSLLLFPGWVSILILVGWLFLLPSAAAADTALTQKKLSSGQNSLAGKSVVPGLKPLRTFMMSRNVGPVPGVTADAIRVGILLPDQGPLAKAGQAVQKLLTGYFEEVNLRGGIYGRVIELVPVYFDPGDPHSDLKALKNQFSREPVFCFIANLGLSPESEAERLLEKMGIPNLVPLRLSPPRSVPLKGRTYYLHSLIFDQARVLVDFLIENRADFDSKVSIVYADDPIAKEGAAGARAQSKLDGLPVVAERAYPAGHFDASEMVEALKDTESFGVLFFGTGPDIRDFILEADQQHWHPDVYGLTELSDIPAGSFPQYLAEQIYLASPTDHFSSPSHRMNKFYNLVKSIRTPGKYMDLQTSAFAGAVLLEASLKVSGWEITRDKLVEKIENMRKLETGVTPPLTYGVDRRVGSSGASVSGIDKKTGRFVVMQGWREPR